LSHREYLGIEVDDLLEISEQTENWANADRAVQIWSPCCDGGVV